MPCLTDMKISEREFLSQSEVDALLRGCTDMDDTEDDWAAQMANPDGKVKPMSLEEAIDLIAWRLQRTREERENIVGKIIAYEEALSLLRNMGANAELTGGAHRAS